MRKIIKLEPAIPALPKRKKVAAYARVSMESEKLMHSLSAQISYFSELIQKNPEWEYAGVYADKFVTGTSIQKRLEFQRLIADCEAGIKNTGSGACLHPRCVKMQNRLRTDYSIPVRFIPLPRRAGAHRFPGNAL